MADELRPATREETALIEHLLAAADVPTHDIRAQLDGLQVMSDCTCGCPSVALYPANATASNRAETPASGPTLEICADCPEGLITLFVRRGCLMSLELAHESGEVAGAWPPIEALGAPTLT